MTRSASPRPARRRRSADCPAAPATALDVLRAEADGHETTPPPRFTEATLVKAMEEKGIGRPSTYAATVGTIQDRGYVRTRGSALVPTWLAFAVTRLLEEHFTELVDYDFTASMEEDLDRIAGGEEHRVVWLQRFYFGDEATSAEGLRHLVDDLGDIDARDISTIQLGDGMVVRVGRYGPYVEEVLDGSTAQGAASNGAVAPQGLGQPRRATITDEVAPDELTPAKARELLDQAADEGRVLGVDPATGDDIVARAGRYGPYVTEVLPDEGDAPSEPATDADAAETLSEDAPATAKAKSKGKGKAAKASKVKPRTASLFTDMDLATVDLQTALRLLSLPRVVGTRRRGRRDHRAERQVRPLPQEGDRLPVHRSPSSSCSTSPSIRPSRSMPSPSSAAGVRPPPRWPSSATDPASRATGGRQGRALRPVRHRRRDQRDAAQGRRPRVDHARAGLRAARRQAGARSGAQSAPPRRQPPPRRLRQPRRRASRRRASTRPAGNA